MGGGGVSQRLRFLCILSRGSFFASFFDFGKAFYVANWICILVIIDLRSFLQRKKNGGPLLDEVSIIASSCDTVVLTDIFCSPEFFRSMIVVYIVGGCLNNRCGGLEFASCSHPSAEDEFPRTLCTVFLEA